ncbi:hypothetical protein G9A89_010157 [Geosiphon pyriformis]|nr:hypothetical protein G9A89_010157 [Geosiphon pyriformis]
MIALVSLEKKAHIYEKRCNRQKTNSNYVEDASSIIESVKHYHFPYPPSYKFTETEHPQKYIKVVTIGTIRKDHFSYRKALFQYFRKDLRIPVETAYAESNFCNYINTKIDCLLDCATDTERLKKQIYQSLLGYSTAMTTQAITETLHIIDTNIKYYEYKNEFNNPVTAQAKSTINKKPRVLSPTTLSYHQTLQSRIVFNPPLKTQKIWIAVWKSYPSSQSNRRKPIPATQILAKHGTPIFYTSESTTLIYTTSPNYYQPPPMTQAIPHYQTFSYSPSRLRAIDYNQGWRNPNNNQVQTNSGLSQPIPHGPAQSRPTPTGYPNQAFYLSLMEDQGFNQSTLVEGGDIEQISQSSKQTKSNIPPATITENTTLATIFSFDINNLNTHSLFTLYTNARVRGIDIKLILNSGSANHAATVRIITVDGNTKTPIGEIDNFPFKINGIQISIKVLVMEAIQYQALVGNNWLSKANVTLNWNTQELQLTFNRQHAQVPAMCGHFKTQHTKELLIEFEDTSILPTIETYQVSWVDDYQTELLLPPTWEEKRKGRAKEELQLLSLGYVTLDQRNLFYQPLKLICVNCEKKLSTMDTCIGDNKKWPTITKYYCRPSLNRLDGYPHDDHKIWRMASAKAKEIKDNPWTPEYNKPNYSEDDFFIDDPNAFQNQYQELASTYEEQEQRLADLNTKLCDHCLISCHFQYCDEYVIEISEGTLIGSISADIQNSEKPQSIPDFTQLFLFCDITSQVWNLPKKSYLFTPEEINKLNLGNLRTLQQMQLKILLNQYADVFASKNEFGHTDIVKHQIDMGDARPIKQ